MTLVTPVLLTVTVLAYLLGGFNTGYYLVRARTGNDLRQLGSGSSGARNAGRVLGGRGFLLVFGVDALKGALAVAAAAMLGLGRMGMAVAMIAAILGHVFPPQLHFRGGRGASTALGGLLMFAPLTAAATLLVCLVLFLATRRQVASGVASYIAMPILAALTEYRWPDVASVAVVAAILVATHRSYLPQVASLVHLAGTAPREVAK